MSRPPVLKKEQFLLDSNNRLSKGGGYDAVNFIAGAEGRNVTYFDTIRITAFEQYVTIDRFFMGILSGILIGMGIITIIYGALGSLELNLTPAYLAKDGASLIGFFLIAVTFGNLFSWHFNKRATLCPTRTEEKYRKNQDGTPFDHKFSAREGQTCLEDAHCTTLDLGHNMDTHELREIRSMYFGRCKPRPPPHRVSLFRTGLAVACFIIGIVFIAINYETVGKLPPASIIASTIFGIFVGWIIGFILS